MMETTKKVRIEEVSDVNFDFPYLEVFYLESLNPFLDIGISESNQLEFKLYPNQSEINLSIDDLDYILGIAKEFLPKALKNEQDYMNWQGKE
jgi:hypothetical protein